MKTIALVSLLVIAALSLAACSPNAASAQEGGPKPAPATVARPG